MRFLIAIVAAVTLTACTDATAPIQKPDVPVCPTLVRTDTMGTRFFQYPGETLVYAVSPLGFVPPCR